jgi:hypothetical protein
MGVNIAAFLVEDSIESTVAKINEAYREDFKFAKRITKSNLLHPIRREADITSLTLFHRNGKTLVHVPFDFMCKDRLTEFLQQFPYALSFAGSETAMAFEFNIFENGKQIAMDSYSYDDEDDCIVTGTDFLGIKDKDIVFDGFVGVLKQAFGEIDYILEFEVDIYNDQHINTLYAYFDELQDLNDREKVDDGFKELHKMHHVQEKILSLNGLSNLLFRYINEDEAIKYITENVNYLYNLLATDWHGLRGFTSHQEQQLLRDSNGYRQGLTEVWAKQNFTPFINEESAILNEIKALASVKIEQEPYIRFKEITVLLGRHYSIRQDIYEIHANWAKTFTVEKTKASLHTICKVWRGNTTKKYDLEFMTIIPIAIRLYVLQINPKPKSLFTVLVAYAKYLIKSKQKK